MQNYAVFLEGNNFLLHDEHGTSKVVGFFVTKVVVATSEQEAAAAALQATWKDPKFAAQGGSVPAPSLEVKVVHQLPASSEMKDTGFTLFEMEAE